MPVTSASSRRSRNAGARSTRAKLSKYIVQSSSDEEDEDSTNNNNENESCDEHHSLARSKTKGRLVTATKTKDKTASSRSGGVLASLNNQLPKHKKKLPASARKKAREANRRHMLDDGDDEEDFEYDDGGEEEAKIKHLTVSASQSRNKTNMEKSGDETKTATFYKTPEPKWKGGRTSRSKQTANEEKEEAVVAKTMMSVMTPPPTSVIVKHGRTTCDDDDEMSPPTSENRRAAQSRVQRKLNVRKTDMKKTRNMKNKVKRDHVEEEIISAMSDDGDEYDEDEDDSDSSRSSSSSSSKASSNNDDERSDPSTDDDDHDDDDDDDDDDEESLDEQQEDEVENIEESESDSDSEEEFEFEDEEFVPDEDEDYGDDESDGSLGDFIVDETPRKSARLSARKATKTAKSIQIGNKGIGDTQNRSPLEERSPEKNEKKKCMSPIEDCSPIQKSIAMESDEAIAEKANIDSSSANGEDQTQFDLTDGADVDETLIEETPMKNDVESSTSPATFNGNETIIEDSPMRTSLPRRALSFQSPGLEEVVVEVIDDDEDVTVDVDCVAVIVDEEDDDTEDDEVEFQRENDEIMMMRSTSDDDSFSSTVQDDTIDEEQEVSNSKTLSGKENNGLSIDLKEKVKYESKVGQQTKDSHPVMSTKNGTIDCVDELRERWLHLQIASPRTQCTGGFLDEESGVVPPSVSNKINDLPPEGEDFQTSLKKDVCRQIESKLIVDRSYRAEGMVKRGQWTLGAKIGVGSFGEVFVGMNTKKGTLMAVKRFHMEGSVKADISTEIELLRSLKHDNIVRYLGAEMDSKTLHIFQEWVPGGSVSSLLAKFGPFSLEVIQSYLSQTLAGLAYLHKNNIMHRDIKGSNVLVNDYGVVKLADFGASKKLANLEDNLMMSMTVRGSPYFMAPEVFEEKYSAKADVWSVGGLAFQMTTGMPPWKEKGFSNPISLFNHIKRQKGPPRMVHPGSHTFTNRQRTMWHMLEDLVRKCFEQDTDKRPTVKQVQDEPFFLSIHECDDDESQCLGLFSPRNGGLALGSPLSPKIMSPYMSSVAQSITDKVSPAVACSRNSSAPLAYSKSIVQWKTTFASPPRQKRLGTQCSLNPVQRSPARHSPSPNATEWPEWAKNELRKQQEQRLSMQTPHKEAQDLQTLMDSLAVSENSTLLNAEKSGIRKLGFTSTDTNRSSSLIGLDLLEEAVDDQSPSKETYEI
jgi:serine/threonine protein kinase